MSLLRIKCFEQHKYVAIFSDILPDDARKTILPPGVLNGHNIDTVVVDKSINKGSKLHDVMDD